MVEVKEVGKALKVKIRSKSKYMIDLDTSQDDSVKEYGSCSNKIITLLNDIRFNIFMSLVNGAILGLVAIHTI